MSHALTSETGMTIQRLLFLIDTENGFLVQVRWCGLPESEDTHEPLEEIYKDVPQLLMKLLRCKNTLTEKDGRQLPL